MTSVTSTSAPVPEFVQAKPFKVTLEADKEYYWCACGKSKNQPFCDGSHEGTGIAPKKFTVTKKDEYYLCGCKITETAPFCDGTHRQEAGIKKYNEFLLKKNSELSEKNAKLKDAMEASEKFQGFLGALAVLSLIAGVGAFVIGKVSN